MEKKDMCLKAFKEQNGTRLNFIAHQLDKYQNTLLEQYGITSKQGRILTFLYFNKDKNVSQKDLEIFLSNTSSTITSIIGNLEKNGFILRYNSADDGRAKCIVMTEKGNQVQKHIFESLQKCENIITKGITEDEHKFLHYILDKVCNNIKDIYSK